MMEGPTMQTRVTTAASYTTSVTTAALGGYTLNEIALAVGIAATVVTVAMNWWFQWRRDKREERALRRGMGE